MRRNNLSLGAEYLIDGTRLIFLPHLRLFVVIPILVNVVIFLLLTSLAVSYFSLATGSITSLMPNWQWLAPVVSTLAVILWVAIALIATILYGYSFSLITNLLAAPFYGILAEKIEAHITGTSPPAEPILQLIGRVTLRELVKLWYFFSRGLAIFIGCLILGFVPLANFFIPIILALWAAWCMAVQYADYAADNNRAPFSYIKHSLGETRYSAWGLGGLTLIGTMIPIVNIFIMPAAVAGGTLYWVRELAPSQR